MFDGGSAHAHGVGHGVKPGLHPVEYVLPVEPMLEMERTIADCLAGVAPGPTWRTPSARTLLQTADLLIDCDLCAPNGELPFAHAYYTVRSAGGAVFSLTPATLGRGAAALQGQPVRTRCNVLAALHALLTRAEALSGEVAVARGWRTAQDRRGPYWLLAEHLGRDGRERLALHLPKLPAAIAHAAREALVQARIDFDRTWPSRQQLDGVKQPFNRRNAVPRLRYFIGNINGG